MRAAQVPPTFGIEDIKEKLKKLPGGPTAPLTVHLRQELDRLNTIIRLATQTLKVGSWVHECVCVCAHVCAHERVCVDAGGVGGVHMQHPACVYAWCSLASQALQVHASTHACAPVHRHRHTCKHTPLPSTRVYGPSAAAPQNLRLAIAGTIALSGNLIDALDALFNARIPGFWLSKSWEAATLGNWFAGMLQRYDQLNKWLNLGRPKAYWMTGFFNPGVRACGALHEHMPARLPAAASIPSLHTPAAGTKVCPAPSCSQPWRVQAAGYVLCSGRACPCMHMTVCTCAHAL